MATGTRLIRKGDTPAARSTVNSDPTAKRPNAMTFPSRATKGASWINLLGNNSAVLRNASLT